jgi:hypothetical protein
VTGELAAACPHCGAELIRRNRVLLFSVGLALAAFPLLAVFNSLFWPLALIAFLAGGYLILWATVGKGSWCRQCKTYRK